jgi:hypothetical protein
MKKLDRIDVMIIIGGFTLLILGIIIILNNGRFGELSVIMGPVFMFIGIFGGRKERTHDVEI